MVKCYFGVPCNTVARYIVDLYGPGCGTVCYYYLADVLIRLIACVSLKLYVCNMLVTVPIPLLRNVNIGLGTRPALNMFSNVTVAPNVFMLELNFRMLDGVRITCTNEVSPPRLPCIEL